MILTTPSSVDCAVRLADEGVPLRAIARAINIPSETLRDALAQARADGRLLELPRDDWPPGFPRDQRALQLSRLLVSDRDALLLTVQRVFKLTRSQAHLLLTLVQNDMVSKSRLDIPVKTVDVHICHIRQKIAAFGIAITTLWGYGYRLPPEAKRKAMDLLLASVAA
jgi:hypothetical protein